MFPAKTIRRPQQGKQPKLPASRTYDDNGNIKQERIYGDDGFPDIDIDYDHDHGQGKPHKHRWTRPKDGSAPTHKNRLPGEKINGVEIDHIGHEVEIDPSGGDFSITKEP